MYRIMEISEHEKAIFYKASCLCGEEEVTIELEKDDFDQISMNIYATIRHSVYYGNWNWFSQQRRRLINTLKYLFLGELKMQTEIIMDDERQIDDFIKALEEGKKRLKMRSK